MRKTKKRFKKLTDMLLKSFKKNNSVARWKQLHIRHNFLLKQYNDAFNENEKYIARGFVPVSITLILKLSSWYKDQELARAWAIQGSKSFCCPISEKILDCKDSFLIKGKAVSSEGIDMLIKKHGLDVIGSIET